MNEKVSDEKSYLHLIEQTFEQTSPECKLARLNVCCRQAIASSAETVGDNIGDVSEIDLRISCDGPIKGLGCQALVSCTFKDINGDEMANLETSAFELAAFAEEPSKKDV